MNSSMKFMKYCYSKQIESGIYFGSISAEDVAEFLGMAVLGNVRSFIKGCSLLFDEEIKITLAIPK